ncbi:Panacea domain-containing protein [Leptospira wolffii]|uniref:Panacea domain-containing protein n=1 Tax=Leptospira wolffii TaxID=409998 RepID=UPI000312D13D|nr:Panacea domain-containing protein [Leptospira wolffii]EPG66282.1 PF13274 family protein [Leptospira wolffii serovar Khorat str. Khorat-H2]
MKTIESLSFLFSQDVKELSKTKWNKLMFFMDGAFASLEESNEGITGLDYVKLPYGPVLDGYKVLLQEIVRDGILRIDQFPSVSDSSVFLHSGTNSKVKQEAEDWLNEQNQEVQTIYKKIVSYFGPHNAVQLSNFSHKLDAWRKPDLYARIRLDSLMNDSFLKDNVGNANFGQWLLTV